MAIIYALVAVTLVSLVSFAGVFFLFVNKKIIQKFISYALALSSGVLLGSIFFELIPESQEALGEKAFIYLMAGFITFFILEKYINWHHCVEGDSHKHKPVAYLALFGDSIHNFIDGAIIGVAFLTHISLGITTTIAVIAHEIPHELGDFSILLFSGFKRNKALWYNFLSACTAILGTLTVILFAGFVEKASPYLVAFGAGNFLYIAASDIIPELHHTNPTRTSRSAVQTLLIIAGVISMYTLGMVFHE